MALHEKMQRELNQQINEESYSAYLYLQMSAYFENNNLRGMAHWMYLQSLEELTHARLLYQYINKRGGQVSLERIEAPKKDWKSPIEIFEAALTHEKHITSRINLLSSLAMELRDHATQSFLQWFEKEQIEEEASAEGVVAQLRLAAGNPAALLMIDRELNARIFNGGAPDLDAPGPATTTN